MTMEAIELFEVVVREIVGLLSALLPSSVRDCPTIFFRIKSIIIHNSLWLWMEKSEPIFNIFPE